VAEDRSIASGLWRWTARLRSTSKDLPPESSPQRQRAHRWAIPVRCCDSPRSVRIDRLAEANISYSNQGGAFFVPTTTVHLPPELLRALDALAARTNASRNRLVIEACERLVHSNRGVWPPGFLEGAHLSTKDRKDLAAAGQALERSIRRARRSRRREPFSHVGA
jgi:hypothetical protein